MGQSMLSITPISISHALSYYHKDSLSDKEMRGQWFGKAAEVLQLRGDIERRDWAAVIHGRHPGSNRQLVQLGPSYGHRAATDMTFSAPKSVSIAALVVGREDIAEADREAVIATLHHIEEHGVLARTTRGGITKRVLTENVLIAIYEHIASRGLDPQRHTHCPVLNMTQMQDTWKALSNEPLFENKMYYGQYYRNELAANIKELGYEIRSGKNGLFEVSGIPEEALREFSRRTAQVEASYNTLKHRYPRASESKLRELAALNSRAAKNELDIQDMHRTWEQRLKIIGLTKEGLAQQLDSGRRQNTCVLSINPKDAVGIAVGQLAANEKSFTREEILRIGGQFSLGTGRLSDLEAAVKDLRISGEIVKLDNGEFITKAIMQSLGKLDRQQGDTVPKWHTDRERSFSADEHKDAAVEHHTIGTESGIERER